MYQAIVFLPLLGAIIAGLIAIVVIYFRNRGTIEVEDISTLKG